MRMEHRVRSRPMGRLGTQGEWAADGLVQGSEPCSHEAPMNINSASASSLKTLNGIGVHYAQKIMDGRPYHHREELLDREILPSHVYIRIRNRLMATAS